MLKVFSEDPVYSIFYESDSQLIKIREPDSCDYSPLISKFENLIEIISKPVSENVPKITIKIFVEKGGMSNNKFLRNFVRSLKRLFYVNLDDPLNKSLHNIEIYKRGNIKRSRGEFEYDLDEIEKLVGSCGNEFLNDFKVNNINDYKKVELDSFNKYQDFYINENDEVLVINKMSGLYKKPTYTRNKFQYTLISDSNSRYSIRVEKLIKLIKNN